MSVNFQIRPLAPGDTRTLARLAHFDGGQDVSRALRQIATPNDKRGVFIAWAGASPVGFMLWRIVPDDSTRAEAVLYVRDLSRQDGIGTALAEPLNKILPPRGVTSVDGMAVCVAPATWLAAWASRPSFAPIAGGSEKALPHVW